VAEPIPFVKGAKVRPSKALVPFVGFEHAKRITQPDPNGHNDAVAELCELIIDYRNLVPVMALKIAVTLRCYAQPAEMMSKKQEWHIRNAEKLLVEAGIKVKPAR